MALFDNEFFPTPTEVLEQMGIDCYGKVVWEPQAGKGDIANWLQANGAKEVLVSEKHSDLRKLLGGFRMIAIDSFEVKSEDISHVQMIVMNPPFSNADSHILHAWKIAPEGCEVIALCNYTTVFSEEYNGGRKELQTIIKNYGEKQDLGSCFDQAERKTDVQVALVRLFKPVVSSDFDYDGFYYDMDDTGSGNTGVMQYNEIRAVVNSYVAAVSCFDRFQAISREMNGYTGMLGFHGGLTCTITHENNTTSKETFAKALQKAAWKGIFDKMNLAKFVTKGVMEKVNKFIESRQNYPFTMKNIYRMFEIIVGTREENMNKAIVEAVDNFTKHTAENRFGVEGWKTNSGYMLNRKFICSYISESGYRRGLTIKYSGNMEYLTDLCKALCYVTGKNYNDIPDIRSASLRRDEKGEYIKHYKYSHDNGKTSIQGYDHAFDYEGFDSFEANTWYEWGFFKFKVYGKGTGHFMFKSEDDWVALNRAYAKIKGQIIPEKHYDGKRTRTAKKEKGSAKEAAYCN